MIAVNATGTETFYSAAFSCLSCAKFWHQDIEGQTGPLSYRYLCPIVAKYGDLEALKFARGIEETNG